MQPTNVKIKSAEFVTHNVRRITLDKPADIDFVPGQAADVSINAPGYVHQKRPFTFTGLPDWDTLEFTIKIYADHDGVTNYLGKIDVGQELIIHDVFGAIEYHGQGIFLAGGAGVTPFISIFRQLEKDKLLGNNKLIFSNKTARDIILEDEFTRMLGKNFINTLTKEASLKYDHRKIDAAYLKEKVESFDQYFYICGPDPMVEELHKTLISLGASDERIVIEQF